MPPMAETDTSEALHDLQDQIARGADSDEIERLGTVLGVERFGVIRVADGSASGTVRVAFSVYETSCGQEILNGNGQVSTEIGVLEDRLQEIVVDAMTVAMERPSVCDGSEPDPPVCRPGEICSGATGPIDDGGSIFGEWWFWTIVGVVAAGAVVGGILLLDSEDTAPGGTVVIGFGRGAL